MQLIKKIALSVLVACGIINTSFGAQHKPDDDVIAGILRDRQTYPKVNSQEIIAYAKSISKGSGDFIELPKNSTQYRSIFTSDFNDSIGVGCFVIYKNEDQKAFMTHFDHVYFSKDKMDYSHVIK